MRTKETIIHRVMSFVAIGVLAMALSGCALWSELTGSDTAASARAAASVVLTTYRDTYQPAVLVYGKLAPCSATVTTACRDASVWAKLKAIDLAAASSVDVMSSLLAGSDTSDETVTKIEAATTAIQSAISQIKDTGVVSATTTTSRSCVMWNNRCSEYRMVASL